MTFRYAPASGSDAAFILGLTGPSRSGKTYSALRIAMGMTDGDPSKIAVLDTERGRAGLYIQRFGQFLHCVMEPPFSYARYAEAIDAAADQGARVLIVDSLSHAHEGEGGLLEQHEEELDRMAGQDWNRRKRMTFTAWIKPKRELTRFVHSILRARVPMVFCFRAKEKLKIVAGADPIALGYRAICSDEITFEMTSMLLLPEKAMGIPDLEATATAFREPFDMVFKPGDVLDEALGKRIVQVIGGDKDNPHHALWRQARNAANKGTVHIRDYMHGLSPEDTEAVQPIKGELWRTAKKADENMAGSRPPTDAPASVGQGSSTPQSGEPLAAENAAAGAGATEDQESLAV